jgi:hypothetical protein
MKKLLIILFAFIGSFVNAQDYDFQQLCLNCVAVNGYYCGDDPANWTQYSPDGCVINGWLNDGWEDCVDASDENEAVPTSPEDCAPPPPDCDTVYVEIPVIETDTIIEEIEIPFYIYETIIQFDTIVETEYITTVVIDTVIEEVEVFVPEYIYVTDTVYAEVLDTMFIDVIEYVDVFVYDTIVEIETEYIEIFVVDSIIEYIEVINTEYIDCITGLPCNSSMEEILDKSNNTGLMYNMLGQPIKRPESIYIEDGKIKYILN